MIEIETKTRKWGNSIGVVIPKDKMKTEHLKSNQKVRVIIAAAKVVKAKNIFGKLKEWKKPTKQIMKEVNEELDSKFF